MPKSDVSEQFLNVTPHDNDQRLAEARESEWFLNGTSAHKRLFRAIEVIIEVKTNISNQQEK